MSDFAASWRLSRSRFIESLEGRSAEQLRWRWRPGTLTLGEAALHVAGVEMSFASQLLDANLDGLDAKIKAAATDGVVNDKPFPFDEEEQTPESVVDALKRSEARLVPLIENPSDAIRNKQIVSALGPIIDGNGAFARLGFHAAYHQGQAHWLVTHPEFPK